MSGGATSGGSSSAGQGGREQILRAARIGGRSRTGRGLACTGISWSTRPRTWAPEAFRLLRRLGGPQRPDDLFLVGDGHQRIYDRRASLGACGIEIRGRGRKLRLNYRTTEEIRRFACAVLQGVAVDDLDEGTDDLRGYRSLMHGTPPAVHGCADGAAQARAIAGHLRALRDDGASEAGICLVLPTNRDVERWEQILAGEGIATRRIQRRAADDPAAPGVRLATMHRVKGLQFDHVVLPDLDAGRFPDPHVLAQLADEIERRRYGDRCRSLLFVALTRARLSALISFVGHVTTLLSGPDPTSPEAGTIGCPRADPR